MEVLTGFAIQTQLVASGLPGPFGGVGWWGVVFTSFSICQDGIKSFFPYNFKDGTAFLILRPKGK